MRESAFLACGILASILYVGMNAMIPMLDEGYRVASQTISELSAIGAPTRPLWVALGILYDVLMMAFGWGVWQSAGPNRPLRWIGILLLVDGVLMLFWPPMQLRGSAFALTDALHIAWMAATGLLMTLAIGLGAAAFGRGFRLYSLVTLALLLGFGAITSFQAPSVAANLPTPSIGIWERMSAGAFTLWVIVLSVTLLRRRT